MPKILAISTEEDCLFLIEKLLKNKGNRVICASTLEEGIEKITAETPEIVIIDCEIFCRDGLASLNKIREVFKGYIIVWALKYFIQKHKHFADDKTIFVNKLSEELVLKIEEISNNKMLVAQPL